MSTLATVFGYGLLSARAAASVAGRFYYATDTQLMYRDNGSTWDTLGLAGAGTGTLTTVKDEGSNLSTAVVSLDFVGAGVTATGTTAVTVTIPAPSAHGCSAIRASGDFSVGNNVYTAVQLNGTDRYDTDSIHDPVTNNTRMVIPSISGVTTGLWSIKASGYTDITSGRADVQFRVNAAANPASGSPIAFNSHPFVSGTIMAFHLTADYVFSAADYVECFVRTSGGTFNVSYDSGNSPIFEVAFLGKVT